MAIITYWNDGKSETGQSMTIAAVATAMALNCFDYKILIINTKFEDNTLEEAFTPKNSISGFFSKGKMDIANGLGGVAKAIMSNKTSPEIITNYTNVIWKNLELLTDKNNTEDEFNKYREYIKEIIKLANKYYDIVIVDLEGDIKSTDIKQIISISNINVVTLTQNINNLDRYKKQKENNEILRGDNVFISIGRYDEKSKYTIKNISKYINEKRVYPIPYNTQFSMDAAEGKADDYIINFRKVKTPHINAPFINSVNEQVNQIINTIKDQQRKIY